MADASHLFGPEHVSSYVETDGEVGYSWRNGAPILLLFTRGRKSGEERINPLIFQPHGDAFLVVGSRGGTDQPPGWLLNLEAEPEIEIQVKGDRFPVRARIADEDEKPELWQKMTAVWPDYDDYQASTERPIPVVVLERTGT